jgi:hypothetical protein
MQQIDEYNPPVGERNGSLGKSKSLKMQLLRHLRDVLFATRTIGDRG